MDYGQASNLTFNLYVREDTVLSGPLQALVDSGEINLYRFVP
jgi:hypothetical protein